MLDKNTNLSAESRDPVAKAPTRTVTLADIFRFVRLRRFALFVPAIVTLALAYGYLQIAVPVYSARTQLIIDARLPQFIPGHNEDTILAWDSAQVESEIAVLSSERIAAAVVAKLGLDRDKDFRASPTPLSRLRDLVGLPKGEPTKKNPDRFRESLDLIQGGLSVRRSGLSYAIDITFSFPDAFRTSEIANAIAEAYIADQLENRSHAARVGGDWLQDRMVLLRSQMNAASQAVQVFRASHNYAIAAKDSDGAQAIHDGGKPEEKTLDELEATAATYRRIFESFLQSYTESVQRQSFPVSDARILTPASIPEVRSAPRASLVYALAGLIGLIFGTGVAVLRQNTDRVVRLPREISDLAVLNDLGHVPRLGRSMLLGFRPRLRRGRSPKFRIAYATYNRLLKARASFFSRRSPYFVAAFERPRARAGDPFCATKTLVDLARRHDGIRSIGVTAPHAGAGSSTIASNLGSLAAACGTNTLVIDADMQRRSLSRSVRSAQKCGLLEVLSGSASLDEAVVRLGDTNLDFLGAGGAGVDSSTIRQEALERLIAELQDFYALIIVDLPPLLPLGAALELCGAVDGVILAVEAGRTSIDLVTESAAYLTRTRARSLGFVLNKCQL